VCSDEVKEMFIKRVKCGRKKKKTNKKKDEKNNVVVQHDGEVK
jgi:hypothetical protein